MIKKFILSLLLLISNLFAFEDSLINLITPTNLVENDATFEIKHRFYGKADGKVEDNFFGLDNGANIGLGLRYMPYQDFEIKASRDRLNKEYRLGVDYSTSIEDYLKAQIDIQYFKYQKSFRVDVDNIFSSLSLQSKEFFDLIKLSTSVAYDGYNKKMGLGFGFNVGFNSTLSFLTFVNKIDFIGEYFPLIDEEKGITGDKDSFAFGIKFKTYQHQFMLIFTNTTKIGTRNAMLGSNTDDLHFGFNILRKF